MTHNRRGKNMASEASATVTQIVKDEIGWVVIINVDYGFGTFDLRFGTLQTNPQAAIEEARRKLFDLGGALMNGYQQEGSLG